MIGGDRGLSLPTKHEACGFYLMWFFRCYEASEFGWKVARTPDDLSIADQDAFFWSALESIARTMNLMISEEHRRLALRNKSKGSGGKG